MKLIKIKQLLSVELLICALGAALVFTTSQAPTWKPPHVFFYAPESLKFFTFGYDETIADCLWIRVLQDVDKCDPSGAHKDAKGKLVCERGWAYSMIRAVTQLAPRFEIAHSVGATLLSGVIDDRDGAAEIFDLGIQRFPKNWIIPYRAGYHALFEMLQPVRAANYLVIAGQRGAPNWVHALAAKLYSKEGRIALARSVLEDAMKNKSNTDWSDRIKQRYEEVLKQEEDKSPDPHDSTAKPSHPGQ